MTIINRNDEKLIRNFCKQVKNNLKEPDHIRNEVEEELFSSIKETALSLINENVSSNMAVKLALDEYESPQSLLRELGEEYKVKKFINTKFLGFSIVLFFVSITVLSGFYFWNIYLVQKDFNRATADLDLFALKEIGNQSSLPYIVEENPTIEAIWTATGSRNNQQNYTDVYPESLSLVTNKYQRKDNFFYRTVFSGYVSDISHTNFQIDMEIAQIHLKPTVFYIAVIILLLSVALFIYWIKENIRYRNLNAAPFKMIKV